MPANSTRNGSTPTVAQVDSIEPIYVSVKDAAKVLAVSPYVCYQLLDADKIESRYHGRRRLVNVASLRAYAASLPKYPEAS